MPAVRKQSRKMMPALKDFSKLLANVPPGAWVAISHDESRLVAYAAEMRDAISKAKEQGEKNPIIFRVPQVHAAMAF